MIDLDQFRDYVVEPTLEDLGLMSAAASELVIGTALQESHLTYIKQLGNGPALGVCQMEPNTHDDIWKNFLAYRNVLSDAVLDIGGPEPQELIWNLKYSVAMCRIHYRRVSSPLPQAGDVEGQAQYWKTYYNTELGKGTTQEYIDNWSRTHG